MAARFSDGEVLSGCHGNALPSVLKSVANLDKDFAGIQIVRSAKGETVIQQNAAVRDVDALNTQGKALAKVLADGEVECRVRLEMVPRDGWVAIREARSVVNVSRCVASPGQRVLSADVQRVPLIMVEQFEAVSKGEVSEAAINVAETERQLIRVSQVQLCAIADSRRAQREFPPVDSSPLNRDGKEHVGVVQIVVIEEVPSTIQEVVGVECPAMKRNGDAELVFFVPLTMKRDESEALVGDELQKGTGCRE